MIKIKMKKILANLKDNYLLELFFIMINLLSSSILRLMTIKNISRISALLIDLSFLIIVTVLSFKIKPKNKIKYFMALSVVFSLICIINSVYYHYYNSFASVSLLSLTGFAADVSDAIFENVLKIKDLIYILNPILLYIFYKYLKDKKSYFKGKNKKTSFKYPLILSLALSIIGALTMPLSSWSRLYKLWNRESVVMNFGIYVYQVDDLIQSVRPQINSLFGHDSSLKEVKEYYEENKYEKESNEYTNIFEGKNIIVIHAESMQTFPMKLIFNNEEVTPNLNKLASEGIFFNNFYSQVGVGTSSDAEFTFNTSLMPSNNGTVFVNYFDREYISIPKLLKQKGYYTYSMHANTGDFWNRNVMHKNLGYDKFYSKDSYVIDETIGLGLSDKSFFKQSVEIMKNIKNNEGEPFYGLLITLTNHTPFSDLELMDEYKTTIDVKINNQTITREYLNGTVMGNYLRSVHYADQAIGEFVDNLEKEGLLENTVLIIYGDHDARLDFDDFNLLYNYDPATDKIKQKDDENYIEYNKYNYELDRKVPFIIWTKDKKFNLEVSTPMGMIDVLPTLGNMIGIHSDYQLGTDVLNKKTDNTVVFTDGSFLTSKIYYNSPKGEIYSINNEAISEDYIREKIEHSSQIIDISNDIISYNLIKEINDEQSSSK